MNIRDRIINGVRLGDVEKGPVNEMKELLMQANAEGTALLENNGMLPLKNGEKIAIFGRCQFEYYKSGSGSGGKVNAPYVTQIYDSIKALSYVEIDEVISKIYRDWIEENPFDFAGGWCLPYSQKEPVLTDEEVEMAANRNDKAIVIIGRCAGEDKDNKDEKGCYLLSEEERGLLKKVSSHFKDVCVLLNAGNIIDMKWVNEFDVSAVMYIWQGGQDGAEAIAELLCGIQYPSGKLSDTIAQDISDYPSHSSFNEPDNIKYTEDIYVGYRYFETFKKEKVLYPFGFGLSYTEFDIKTVSAERQNDKILLEISVKNTGEYKGKEVVQIYFEGKGKNIGYPARQLIAFEKTGELDCGESQIIQKEIDICSMAAYDDIGMTGNKSCYVLDIGEYNIYVGNSVRDAELAYSYISDKIKVIEKLNPVLPLTAPLDRMIGNEIKYQKISPSEHSTIPEVTEIHQTGDRGIKLDDVYNGTESMENFIAQLDDFQLACLSQGEGMNSSKVRSGTGGTFGGLTRTLNEFGIPAICVTDATAGLRFDNGDTATSLPIGTMLACTWNEPLVKELYMYEGMEAYANQVDGLLGPGVNIHRHPLCGRNFEYLSEDPYLSGIIGSGICEGLSRAGISPTVKHFSANNKEANRKTVNMIISERALREIYLKPFEIIVKEGKTKMLMTAYNQINGVFCSSNFDLNTRVLRDEWGFDGMVMTDWWPKTGFDSDRNAVDRKDLPIKAQNDVFMVNANAEMAAADVIEAMKTGLISRGELQRNAINICKFIMSTPAFERYLKGEKIGVKANVNTGELLKVFESERVKSGEKVSIETGKSGEYAVEIEYSSKQSELMQIPVHLYINNVSAGLYMVNGTDGKVSGSNVSLFITKGSNEFKLEFIDDNIDMIKIIIYENGC